MSILKNVVIEEYERLKRMLSLYEKELSNQTNIKEINRINSILNSIKEDIEFAEKALDIKK